jgi:hypothetical protein
MINFITTAEQADSKQSVKRSKNFNAALHRNKAPKTSMPSKEQHVGNSDFTTQQYMTLKNDISSAKDLLIGLKDCKFPDNLKDIKSKLEQAIKSLEKALPLVKTSGLTAEKWHDLRSDITEAVSQVFDAREELEQSSKKGIHFTGVIGRIMPIQLKLKETARILDSKEAQFIQFIIPSATPSAFQSSVQDASGIFGYETCSAISFIRPPNCVDPLRVQLWDQVNPIIDSILLLPHFDKKYNRVNLNIDRAKKQIEIVQKLMQQQGPLEATDYQKLKNALSKIHNLMQNSIKVLQKKTDDKLVKPNVDNQTILIDIDTHAFAAVNLITGVH